MMVIVCLGKILVSVCVDKIFCVEIDDMVLIYVLIDYCYLFDGQIGQWIGD